jgi:hypothetical protein
MTAAQQSYSFNIRDTFFAAVTRMPFFADYTKRKTKMIKVQPELLPFLAVYMLPETMTPDGDANAGFIRFIHALPIGFSVMIANNDEIVAEQTIDAAFWALMNGLWTDPYLNNTIDTLNRDTGISNINNVVFESITRGVRRHVFGAATMNNETPLAELQYDVTVCYRSEWYPTITDDLLLVDVKTKMRPGDSQTDIDSRIQVDMPVDLSNLVRTGTITPTKESSNGRDKDSSANGQDGEIAKQRK